MKICFFVLITFLVPFLAPSQLSASEPVLRFTVADKQPEAGGKMEKYFIEDEGGNKWMMKLSHSANSTRAMANQVTCKVAHRLGFQVPEALICKLDNTTMAQIIKMVPCDGNLKKAKMVDLTDRQREDLQSHQVIDWLFGNSDTHGGQFLFGPDGSIIAVDKDMSFEFFSSSKLNIYWAYCKEFGSIYNKLYRGFRDNHYRLSFKRLFHTIDRTMAFPDKELADLIAPYFVHAFVEKGVSIEEIISSPSLQKRVSDGVNEVLARKRNLRKDFIKFISGLFKERGETFTPPLPSQSPISANPLSGLTNLNINQGIPFSISWLALNIPSLDLDGFEKIAAQVEEGASTRLTRRYVLNTPVGNLFFLMKTKGLELKKSVSDFAYRKLHKNDSAAERFDIYSDFDFFHTTNEEQFGTSTALNTYTVSPSETAFMVSTLLLSSKKIKKGRHSLLLWNIARYLGAEKSDSDLQRALDSIDINSGLKLAIFNLHPRYENAIISDLKNPYTDDDVFIRLINVERKLTSIIHKLGLESTTVYIKGDYPFRSFGCNSTFEVYLTGYYANTAMNDAIQTEDIMTLISEATVNDGAQPECYVLNGDSDEFEYACTQLSKESLMPFVIKHSGTSLGSDYELLLNNSMLRNKAGEETSPANADILMRLWIK